MIRKHAKYYIEVRVLRQCYENMKCQNTLQKAVNVSKLIILSPIFYVIIIYSLFSQTPLLIPDNIPSSSSQA